MCQNVVYYTFWMVVLCAMWVVTVLPVCLFITPMIHLYTTAQMFQIFHKTTRLAHFPLVSVFEVILSCVLQPSCSLWGDCCLVPFKKKRKKISTGRSIFADAAAAEEPGSGGRNGAGTAGRGSGRAHQLHWPNHHANREAHLPHEETAVAASGAESPRPSETVRLLSGLTGSILYQDERQQ